MSRWIESVRRPRSWLLFVVIALYGWTVTGPAFIDDYRDLRLMREYREGRRSELGLYRFLRGGDDNRALRSAGYYPWWLADEVRYQHSRPIAERWLYGQFLIFGDNTFAYHAVSILLYGIGVLLAARLFAMLTTNRNVSRWAALIFAIAAAHAVPVVFISQQCDLLGLILVVAAMCAAVSWIQNGRGLSVLTAMALYALSLGTKESSLPVALFPLLFGWALRAGKSHLRRGATLSVSMLLLGGVWLSIYAARGFGANNAMMLDPLHETGHYLAELPVRALVLLATWLLPINPFIFYLRPFGQMIIPVLAGIGVLTLLTFFWLIRGSGRSAAMMTVWTLLFLPLLVCTPPDDRNLLLPGIGFAFLAVLWLIPENPQRRVRWLPLLIFVVLQIPTAIANAAAIRMLESTVEANLRTAEASFGRDCQPGDCIFFLNLDTDPQVLFAQYHFDWLRATEGKPTGVRVAFLSDIREPVVHRVDDHTLRIEGPIEPLLEGFLGKMGYTRNRPRHEGDEFDAGVFKARITRMTGDHVREATIRFAEPLASDHYRFIWCSPGEKARVLPAITFS